MRKAALAAVLFGAAAAHACTMDERPAGREAAMAAAQAELARALDGRAGGAPETCVSTNMLRDSRGIGDDVILFRGVGGRVYVNRPPGGCRGLQYGDVLVTRTPTGQLCRGDIAQLVDPRTGPSGSCVLGAFVPYDRVR